MSYHAGSTYKATSLTAMAPVLLLSPVFLIAPVFSIPGDGNEAIGALIQNYIREIEELR